MMPLTHRNNDFFPRLFFFANYLLLLAVVFYIARDSLMQWGSGRAPFVIAAAIGYAFVYILPALLVTGLVWRLSRWLARGLAVLLGTATLILLLVDSVVYGLYGFHLNGFVWNLIITPGGIESMGGSESASITVALICLALLLFEVALMALATRWRGPKPRWTPLVTVLVLCMLGERAAYGLSHFNGYRAVLGAAQEVPFYQQTTFRSFLVDLGYTPSRDATVSIADNGRLNYPLHALRSAADAPPLNVLFLVSESLRGDMLTPEIMPNLWRFARRHGVRFTHNISGGNGTRMGIFSLMYGLPGNYWFSFLNARKPPVLVTELQRRGYDMHMYTSARFSYPEFDKTVFASVPASQLTSDDDGPGWTRDRRNVARLNDFINSDHQGRPFFSFLFFESPHARYYFPKEAVIRPDYLPVLNYATMDVHEDIQLIKNRYINAVHHLDQQLGRVFDNLEQQGLLDSTIVVIAGDHGEEFMEHGRWGHNSAFHNEQIHTPLVVAGPGFPDGEVSDMPTSHLDVVPTVLQHLGVTNPVSDYSIGIPLGQAPADRYRLVASWNSVAYVGPRYKVVMPVRAGGLAAMKVSTADDQPVADANAVLAKVQGRLVRVLKDMSRFYRKD